MKTGDQVRVVSGSDGHSGRIGAIIKEFESGRFLVFLDQFNILNLSKDQIEECVSSSIDQKNR